MAYPLIQAPTLAEFKQQLKTNHDVDCLPVNITRVTCPVPLANSYFSKQTPSGPVFIPVPDLHDDDRVHPALIRSICKNLGIDPAAFGLNLG